MRDIVGRIRDESGTNGKGRQLGELAAPLLGARGRVWVVEGPRCKCCTNTASGRRPQNKLHAYLLSGFVVTKVCTNEKGRPNAASPGWMTGSLLPIKRGRPVAFLLARTCIGMPALSIAHFVTFRLCAAPIWTGVGWCGKLNCDSTRGDPVLLMTKIGV